MYLYIMFLGIRWIAYITQFFVLSEKNVSNICFHVFKEKPKKEGKNTNTLSWTLTLFLLSLDI